MKLIPALFAVAIVALSGAIASPAAALDSKSLAPGWVTASAAEREQWLKTYKFKTAAVDHAEIAACLDNYAPRPLFATNALEGVTQMCESVSNLSK